jgi:hypothetical protein
MGYTRHYKLFKELDKELFVKYSNECKYICEQITNEFGHGIAGAIGEGEPEFTETYIDFNGIIGLVDDLSHENFYIDTTEQPFNFCKTNRKPYDKHVCACLYLLKEYFGDIVEIKSDGGNKDEEVIGFIKSIKRDNKINTLLQ